MCAPRVRQTGFAIAGVATGVGFSIMMAALMQGSQDDFIQRLVNTLPHITVSDERRTPPQQPAETAYAAAEIHGLTPEARRPGIKNPLATMAALEAWLPGAVAPSVKVQAIIRYANRDVGTSVIGIDPQREAKVSDLPKQMRGATLDRALPRHQRHHPRRPAGREDRRAHRRQHHAADQRRRAHQRAGGRLLPYRHAPDRREHGLRADQDRADPARQTGLVNELRVRARRSDGGARDRRAHRERHRLQVGVLAGGATRTCSRTFVIRNIIMYTVVGAILLVASFGTYNIISTITHEKARDIAIMKSLGLERMHGAHDLRDRGADHRAGRRARRLRARLSAVPRARLDRDQEPVPRSDRLPLAYTPLHYLLAGLVALVSSVAAGYLPARKAARVHPVDIIRGAT